MKTFISFIVLVFAVSLCSAQDRILINRIDRQLGEAPRIDHYVTAQTYAPAGDVQKTFTIIQDEQNLTFGLNDYQSFHAKIKNISSEAIKLVYYRTQTRENSLIYEDTIYGWSTAVCFGETCYPAEQDYLPANQAFQLNPGEECDFKLNVTTKLLSSDSNSINVVIGTVGISEDDTIGMWMTAVSTVGGAVSYEQPVRRSTIRSIYPSPLITGNAINVSIDAAREAGYRYSIIDPFGREVAFGTSQRKLNFGENRVKITSLEGLTSGSYLLKINFSDGTSDAYSFTIVR